CAVPDTWVVTVWAKNRQGVKLRERQASGGVFCYKAPQNGEYQLRFARAGYEITRMPAGIDNWIPTSDESKFFYPLSITFLQQLPNAPPADMDSALPGRHGPVCRLRNLLDDPQADLEEFRRKLEEQAELANEMDEPDVFHWNLEMYAYAYGKNAQFTRQ